jgi:hypothetical protein
MAIYFKVEELAGWRRIWLAGNLRGDLDAPLAALAANLSSCVRFNFANVEAADADGSHAWIRFIRQVSGERRIVFEECLPCILEQIRILPAFKGRCQIVSAYAPFACKSCGAQQHILVARSQDSQKLSLAAAERPVCHWCGNSMVATDDLRALFDVA